MTRTFAKVLEHLIVTAIGLGLAYAVATSIGQAVGDSLNESAALIAGAGR